MAEKKKAWLYLKARTDEDLKAQKSLLLEYADKAGYEVTEVAADYSPSQSIRPYSRRSSTAVLRSAAGTGRSRSEKRRHRWSCGGCAAVPRLPGWNSRP